MNIECEGATNTSWTSFYYDNVCEPGYVSIYSCDKWRVLEHDFAWLSSWKHVINWCRSPSRSYVERVKDPACRRDYADKRCRANFKPQLDMDWSPTNYWGDYGTR